MRILFDSKQKKHKSPFGCVRQHEPCTIRLHVPRHCAAMEVYLCIEGDNNGFFQQVPLLWEDLVDGYDYYCSSFSLELCGLYFYYFKIVTTQSFFNLYKEGSHDTNIGLGDQWQLSCFPLSYETPEDFKGRVMYQIYPDRFYAEGQCDVTNKLQPFFIHQDTHDVPVYLPDENGKIQNNDFFGGNLKGIIAKLGYLKSLHVSVLYLNPIFMAYSNHRYDTADYKRVDPLLGTEADFSELCEKAHQLGMKVILDGVYSHTGSNSVYFDKNNIFGNGAYHNQHSPYRGWFQFNDTPPDGYTSWWGINTLPCVNELNPDFLNYIIEDEDSVIAHWLNLGADGYRLDVADELPDEFIARLHQKVKNVKPNSIVIGEVWEDASNKVSYGVRRSYFTANELDSAMNYPYKDAIIGFVMEESSGSMLAETIMTIAENYPKPILDCVMNSLSTHDTMRILTVLGTNNYALSRDEKAVHTLNHTEMELAIQRLKLAIFLQFTLPGSACIYYGDEAGLQGFEDPFNRRYFPWDTINYALLDFYRHITALKDQYHALQKGDIQIILEDHQVCGFTRKLGESRITAYVNMCDKFILHTDQHFVILHNGVCGDGTITLDKYGFVLFEETVSP